MNKRIKTAYPAALIMLFVAMIMAAITENTKGVFVPGFKENFAVGNKEISYMIIGTTAVYMIATFIGGYLCEKIGQKKVFISGLVILLLTLIMMSFSKSFAMLTFWISLNSAGLALAGIASNTVLPVLVLSMQSLVMNLLHFFLWLWLYHRAKNLWIFIKQRGKLEKYLFRHFSDICNIDHNFVFCTFS